VFSQDGGSCTQAAEVGYTFNYEYNRKFNTTGVPFNYMYTYNFLNGGDGANGTYPEDGFKIIKQNGCPTACDFDDPAVSPNSPTRFCYWMSGYDKYKNGMNNSISGIYWMGLCNTVNDLNIIKHWIADHGTGESSGGLLVFAVYTVGMEMGDINLNSQSNAGKKYIKKLGSTAGPHAMTIVGYDDDCWIKDINGDGQYTNDRDVNGDGIFDIKDFEKGAFKIVNSHGTSFGDQGFAFLPYHLMYEDNPGFVIDYVYGCKIKDPNEDKIVYKINIEHSCRDKINIKLGHVSIENPSNPPSFYTTNLFNSQGGCKRMRGAYSGPIEIGLDYNLITLSKIIKDAINVVETGDQNNSHDGIVHSFSLVDYRWNEEFELQCLQTNVPIVNNGNTILSIDYHLIPHEAPITVTELYRSNRVSRFGPTLTNGADMILYNDVVVDMYNSTITVGEGSTLGMYPGSKFVAKRGTNKIIINGDMQIAEGVSLIAEGDATLEVILNNSNETVNFSGCNFTKCQLTNNSSILNITNKCKFSNCGLVSSKNTTTIEK
jgi:hypothetical protein